MNALNSPLLRLPAELKNSIFAYVFSDNVYLFNGTNAYLDKTTSITSFDENDLGVLVASRQLHAETSLLPYHLALFQFKFRVSKVEWSYCVERFVKNRTKEQELAMDKNMMVSHFGKYAGSHRYYHGTSAWHAPYHVRRESMEYPSERRNGQILAVSDAGMG